MSSIDVMELAGVMRDAAKAEILPRFRRLDSAMVSQKSEAIDLVTEADTAAERVITREDCRTLARTRWWWGKRPSPRRPSC